MTLSEPAIYLLACILGHILITYSQNFMGLYRDLKSIKDKGENPLAMTSIVCMILAFVVEVGSTILFLGSISSSLDFITSSNKLEFFINVSGIFIAVYVIRNTLAYLVVWLYWAIIVKLGVNQTKKELLAEIGEEDK
ncbi:membrane protein [Bacillus phage vB_BceH_LY2]|nr:membrane protein [Bacillus phage vB_BceH_LY2]